MTIYCKIHSEEGNIIEIRKQSISHNQKKTQKKRKIRGKTYFHRFCGFPLYQIHFQFMKMNN